AALAELVRAAEPLKAEEAEPQPATQEPPRPESSADRWLDPIDDAAFHGLAGDVVRAISPFVESDDVAVLVTFLTAIGNIIGDGPHVSVGATAHPARLFACLVGRTAVS